MRTEQAVRYEVVDDPQALKDLAKRMTYSGLCYPAGEGQLLHEWWKVSKGHYEKVVIVAAFDGELPIGGILHHKYNTHLTMFFVNPEYRRQGIAMRMVERLRTHPYGQRVIEASAGWNDAEWRAFYQRAKILHRNTDGSIPYWVPPEKAHAYVNAHQATDRSFFKRFILGE